MNKKTLILGGYGNVGRPLARFLARQSGIGTLQLGGRDSKKAQSEVDKIINETGFLDLEIVEVDASNPDSLRKAFQDVDMVVVASSTLKYAKNVALIALETGTDYLDTQLSSPSKLEILKGLNDQITKSGRIFITDGGFHPGLLGAIVRYADLKIGPLSEANIYVALKIDWGSLEVSKGTDAELVDELRNFDMTVLQNGEWVKTGYSSSVRYDFGEPFFKQYCAPMLIEEMKMLPEHMPELKETGFYVTGFNKILDYLLFPIIMLFLKLKMNTLAVQLFRFGLKLSKPPFGIKLVAECKGEKGSLKICISDTDGYLMTAIPIAACLKQYFDGTISTPGLYLQAWVVEPERFFKDMKELGLKIELN